MGEPGQARKGAAVAHPYHVRGGAGARKEGVTSSRLRGSTSGHSARIMVAIVTLIAVIAATVVFPLMVGGSACASFPVVSTEGVYFGKACTVPFPGVFFPPGTDTDVIEGATDAYNVLVRRTGCSKGFVLWVRGSGRSATLPIYAAMYALCRGGSVNFYITGDLDPNGILLPVSLEGKCGKVFPLYAPEGSTFCPDAHYLSSIEQVEALVRD